MKDPAKLLVFVACLAFAFQSASAAGPVSPDPLPLNPDGNCPGTLDMSAYDFSANSAREVRDFVSFEAQACGGRAGIDTLIFNGQKVQEWPHNLLEGMDALVSLSITIESGDADDLPGNFFHYLPTVAPDDAQLSTLTTLDITPFVDGTPCDPATDVLCTNVVLSDGTIIKFKSIAIPPGGGGDPFFVDFTGRMFAFMGEQGGVYNIMSSKFFQLNTLFLASYNETHIVTTPTRFPERAELQAVLRSEDGKVPVDGSVVATTMTEAGMKVGRHTIHLTASGELHLDDRLIVADGAKHCLGVPSTLDSTESDQSCDSFLSFTKPAQPIDMSVPWDDAPEVMQGTVELRLAPYALTLMLNMVTSESYNSDAPFLSFSFSYDDADLLHTSDMHGIVGQSAQRIFEGTAYTSSTSPTTTPWEGEEDDYLESNLFSNDSRFNRYVKTDLATGDVKVGSVSVRVPAHVYSSEDQLDYLLAEFRKGQVDEAHVQQIKQHYERTLK